MTDLSAVLFDFAGTVLMPLDAPTWVRRAAQQTGLVLPDAELDALAERYLDAGLPGGPYPDDVPEAIGRLYAIRDLGPEQHRAAYLALMGSVPEPVPGFTEAMYEMVLAPDGWIAYPDAPPVIEALQAAGVPAGLISNIGYEIRPILSAHGLDTLAQHATLSCEHGMMKPDRRLFEAALETIGADPDATLMVGDHATADTGGVALGIRTLVLPMSAPGQPHGLDAVTRLLGL